MNDKYLADIVAPSNSPSYPVVDPLLPLKIVCRVVFAREVKGDWVV